jgi:histone deacetylase complex regulatory component SIN3
MLREQRQNGTPTIRDQIKYRIHAQLTANADENVYKFDLMPESDILTARILRKEDSSVDVTEATAYKVYTESYFINQPTEGLHQAPRVPFLKRCGPNLIIGGNTVKTDHHQLRNLGKKEETGEAQTSSLCELAIHIDETSYRLKYEGEGEDIFARYGLDKRRLKVGKGKVLKLESEEMQEDGPIIAPA